MFWQLDSLIEHMFDLTDEEQVTYCTCRTLLFEGSVETLDLLLGELGLPRHLLHIVWLVSGRLQKLEQSLVIPATAERLLVEHHVVDPLHEVDRPPLAPDHDEVPLDHVVTLLLRLDCVLGNHHSVSEGFIIRSESGITQSMSRVVILPGNL